MKLGELTNWYWELHNGEWFERRERILTVVECPRCGKDVPCYAETDGWIKDENGRWKHNSYGPAMGEHHGLLFADSWDGCRVYNMAAAKRKETLRRKKQERQQRIAAIQGKALFD